MTCKLVQQSGALLRDLRELRYLPYFIPETSDRPENALMIARSSSLLTYVIIRVRNLVKKRIAAYHILNPGKMVMVIETSKIRRCILQDIRVHMRELLCFHFKLARYTSFY